MVTYSDDYPQIRRLQGRILFPDKIEKVEVETEEGPRLAYRYNLISIENGGQQVEDYELFRLQNYVAIRGYYYGSWQDQLDMQYHGTWTAHIDTVKADLPKP